MRNLLTAICLVLVFIPLFSQNAYFNDLEIFDGSGQLYPSDILVDHDGNTLLIGNYYYDVDLDPGPDSAKYFGNYTGSISPAFIVKLDSSGNYLWSAVLPKVYNRSQKLRIDHDNSVFVAGMFRDTMDFDPSATGTDIRYSYAPYDDAFILKLDSSGAFQWVKTFGRSGGINVRDFEVDHSGNIIFTGVCEGANIVFHPNASAPTYNAYFRGYFALKYNSAGSFVWLKQFGPVSQYRCKEVEVTSNNEIIISGEFDGIIDFDPGPATVNLVSQSSSDDVFILKLDSAGTFQWATRYGGPNTDQLFTMEIDEFDNLHFVGNLRDSIDFDPGPGFYYEKSKQWSSKYVLKLNAQSAGFRWVRSFVLTDPYQVDFNHLHIDHEGGVYTTGAFKREFYVHPDTAINDDKLPSSSQSTLTSKDAFIHKFDSTGAYMWAHSLHSSEFQRGKAVTTTKGGRVLWLGEFENTVDFGLGGTPVNRTVDGGFDMFLLSMEQCDAKYGSLTDSACFDYITPLGDTLYASGQYQYALPGPLGCDSIVNLDLTILDVNTTVIIDSVVGELLATAQVASFRWLNCDSAFVIIPGATNYLFTPVVNGNYAVEVTSADGCVDTSDCIPFNYVEEPEYVLPDVRIYPNPARGYVMIDQPALGSGIRAELMDASGRLIRSYDELTEHPARIDLPDRSGFFVLRLYWDDQHRTFRIINQ